MLVTSVKEPYKPDLLQSTLSRLFTTTLLLNKDCPNLDKEWYSEFYINNIAILLEKRVMTNSIVHVFKATLRFS